MLRNLRNNIDYHNPLNSLTFNILGPICPLITCIIVFSWQDSPILLALAWLLIPIHICLYINNTCGKLRNFWMFFAGTAIRTTLCPKTLLVTYATSSEEYDNYIKCWSWLESTFSSYNYAYKYNYDRANEIIFLRKSDAVLFKLTWGGDKGIIRPNKKDEDKKKWLL